VRKIGKFIFLKYKRSLFKYDNWSSLLKDVKIIDNKDLSEV